MISNNKYLSNIVNLFIFNLLQCLFKVLIHALMIAKYIFLQIVFK